MDMNDVLVETANLVNHRISSLESSVKSLESSDLIHDVSNIQPKFGVIDMNSDLVEELKIRKEYVEDILHLLTLESMKILNSNHIIDWPENMLVKLDMVSRAFNEVNDMQSELEEAELIEEDDDLDQLFVESKNELWTKIEEIKELVKQ